MSWNLSTQIHNLSEQVEQFKQNAISNPLQADLNANSKNITNANSIQLNGNTVSTNSSNQLTVNGTPISGGGSGNITSITGDNNITATTNAGKTTLTFNKTPSLNSISINNIPITTDVSNNLFVNAQQMAKLSDISLPNIIANGQSNFGGNPVYGVTSIGFTNSGQITSVIDVNTSQGRLCYQYVEEGDTPLPLAYVSDIPTSIVQTLSNPKNSSGEITDDSILITGTAENPILALNPSMYNIQNIDFSYANSGFNQMAMAPYSTIGGWLGSNSYLRFTDLNTTQNIVCEINPSMTNNTLKLFNKTDQTKIVNLECDTSNNLLINSQPLTLQTIINNSGSNVATSPANFSNIAAKLIIIKNDGYDGDRLEIYDASENTYLYFNGAGSFGLWNNVTGNRIYGFDKTGALFTPTYVSCPTLNFSYDDTNFYPLSLNNSDKHLYFGDNTVASNRVPVFGDIQNLVKAGTNTSITVNADSSITINASGGSASAQNIQQVLTTGSDANHLGISNLSSTQFNNNGNGYNSNMQLSCFLNSASGTDQRVQSGLEILCSPDPSLSPVNQPLAATLNITDTAADWRTIIGHDAEANEGFIGSRSSVIGFLDTNLYKYIQLDNSAGLSFLNYSMNGQEQVITTTSVCGNTSGQLVASGDIVAEGGNLVLATIPGNAATTNLSQIWFGSTGIGQGKISYTAVDGYNFLNGGNQLLNIGQGSLTFGNEGMAAPSIQITGIPAGGGTPVTGTVYDTVFNPIPLAPPITIVTHTFVSSDYYVQPSDFYKLHTFTPNGSGSVNIILPNTGVNVGDYIDFSLAISNNSNGNFFIKNTAGSILQNLTYYTNPNQMCRFVCVNILGGTCYYVSNSNYVPTSSVSTVHDLTNPMDTATLDTNISSTATTEKIISFRVISPVSLQNYNIPSTLENHIVRFKIAYTSQPIKINNIAFAPSESPEFIFKNGSWEIY